MPAPFPPPSHNLAYGVDLTALQTLVWSGVLLNSISVSENVEILFRIFFKSLKNYFRIILDRPGANPSTITDQRDSWYTLKETA